MTLACTRWLSSASRSKNTLWQSLNLDVRTRTIEPCLHFHAASNARFAARRMAKGHEELHVDGFSRLDLSGRLGGVLHDGRISGLGIRYCPTGHACDEFRPVDDGYVGYLGHAIPVP